MKYNLRRVIKNFVVKTDGVIVEGFIKTLGYSKDLEK